MARKGVVLNMAGEVLDKGIEMVAKNADNVAQAVSKNADNVARVVSKNADDVARAAQPLPKLKTNQVFEGIKDLISPSLENVDDNKLRQLLKDMGHTTKSSNGAVKLGFGTNATEDTIFKVADSIDSMINRTGAKNIDDLLNHMDGVKKEAIARTKPTGYNLSKEIDSGIIARNKNMKNAAESAEVFQNPTAHGGVVIGDKNPVYVSEGGDIAKRYNSEVKANPNINADEAASRASSNPKNLNGSTPQSNATAEAKSFKDLKKSRYNSKHDYMKFQAASEYEDVIEAYNKKDFSNSILKDKNIDKNTTMAQIEKMRSEAINNASDELDFRGWMGYNRVPQKVTGVAGTAWLVNKLAATGGQQTNSQLYGQTPY